MATVSYSPGTSQSYTTTAIGQKIDWSPIITNLSPHTTVLMNRISNGEKAIDMQINWQEEKLKAPQKNAQLEKLDYTTAPVLPRARLDNFIQHFFNSFEVSDAQENRENYGMTSEFKRQELNTSIEHANDMEWALLKNGTGALENGATPAQMTGIKGFIDQRGKTFTVATKTLTATAHGYMTGDIVHFYFAAGGAVAAGVAVGRKYYVGSVTADTFKLYTSLEKAIIAASNTEVNITSAGTNCYVTKDNVIDLENASDLTEDAFNRAMQRQRDRGGKADTVVASTYRKAQMANWTAGAVRTQDAASDKRKQVISFYESEHGVVELMSHSMQDDDRIDILELGKWDKAMYIPTKSFELPKKGSYRQFAFETYMSIRSFAPLANAAVINIA